MPALEVKSVASALPAIIFIVFFLVYRDQGFLKPYLDQQKKQKTIRGLEAKLDSRNKGQIKSKRSSTTTTSPMQKPLVQWSLRPAIIFIVFFLVYRDQGFLKPYLDQQKKQKTIKGGATVCARYRAMQ